MESFSQEAAETGSRYSLAWLNRQKAAQSQFQTTAIVSVKALPFYSCTLTGPVRRNADHCDGSPMATWGVRLAARH